MMVAVRGSLVVMGLLAAAALALVAAPPAWELPGLANEVARMRAAPRDPPRPRSFRQLYLVVACEHEAEPRCDARQMGIAVLLNLAQLGAALALYALAVRLRGRRGGSVAARLSATALAWGAAAAALELGLHLELGVDGWLLFGAGAVALFAVGHRLCARRGLELATESLGLGLIGVAIACLSGPMVGGIALRGAAEVARSSFILAFLLQLFAALFATVPLWPLAALLSGRKGAD
jgi:hypothetical protein